MKIFGVDYSINGAGVCVFELDSELKIVSKDYLCFTDKVYISEKSNGKIINYKKQIFRDYIDKNNWFHNQILNFTNGCSYGAIEDYSFASKGVVFHIGEACGNIKSKIYSSNIKLRIYNIAHIKKFASSFGGSGKELVVDSYDKLLDVEKFDLDYLLEDENSKKKKKKDPRYESPRSDIIDAFWICQMLLTELRLRRGLVQLRDLDEKKIEVFNAVSEKSKTNILATNFLYNGEQ